MPCCNCIQLKAGYQMQFFLVLALIQLKEAIPKVLNGGYLKKGASQSKNFIFINRKPIWNVSKRRRSVTALMNTDAKSRVCHVMQTSSSDKAIYVKFPQHVDDILAFHEHSSFASKNSWKFVSTVTAFRNKSAQSSQKNSIFSCCDIFDEQQYKNYLHHNTQFYSLLLTDCCKSLYIRYTILDA